MLVEILVVHPAVTIVKAGVEEKEVPTSWFPAPPKIGQQWDVNLEPIKTSSEQYAALNEYLSRG